MTDYNEQENSFPDESVSPKVKETKGYILAYIRSMYSSYERDSRYERINNQYITNREYAEGLQSIDQYKDTLEMNGDSSFANLSWSVVPIIPKFVDLLMGEMDSQEYKIGCEAIDQISLTNKDDARNRYMVKMELKKYADTMKEATGIDLNMGEYVPESKEELDLHMQMDYKQDIEIAMEESLRYVYKNNNWKEVSRKVKRDAVICKKSAVKVFIDDNDDISVRYVDPVKMIHSYSENDEFDDIRYCGEIMNIEVRKLRELVGSEMDEEDLFEIAKKYGGRNDNREWPYESNYNDYYNSNNDHNGYDNFLIPVLDAEFYTIDKKVYEEKDNGKGSFYLNEKGSHYEVDEDGKDKKKKHEKLIEVTYKGLWVMGTDYLYNYGRATDLLREVKNGVYSSNITSGFIVFSPNKYNMENKSLVERMIPHADMINIVFMKTQQLLAKLRPPGLSIDTSTLVDVFLGKGVKSGPMDLVEILNQTGNLFYNGKMEDGQYVQRKPVEPIKDHMGAAFTELQREYEFQKQQLRDITGINETRESSSLDSNAPVATQQMSMRASRNATRPITYTYLNIYKRVSKNIAMHVLELADQGRLDFWDNVIGKFSLRTLKDMDSDNLSEIGVSIEPLPDDDDKAVVEAAVQQSLAAGTLRIEDAMRIREIYKVSTKNAIQYLILRRKTYDQEQKDLAAHQSEMNAKVQQESAAQAHQMKAAESQMEQQREIALLQAKYSLEDANAEKEHQRKLDEIMLEGRIKTKQIEVASQENLDTSESNSTQQPQPRVFPRP